MISLRRGYSSLIVLKDLVKSFDGKKVLRGVNLIAETGKTTVVIGRSGTGKSVLLKHIIGLMKADSGSVLVDGLDVTKLQLKELYEIRRKMGMVFQASALFDSLTVAENVGLGLKKNSKLSKKEIDVKVRESISRVGLSGTESLYPAQLSGGMKKRAGVARAVAMDPDVLLYDEPTSGLDPVIANTINKLIVRLREELGVTSIAVTHDMNSAYMIGDKIAMLHDGIIHFEGTIEETKQADDPIVRGFLEGEGEEFLLEDGTDVF